ncbi:hypothetical protein B0J11DRAFT_585900 [Dendryphion nanum]|uniref:MADS-box domain-containing protein n=1 Tax=Dendryphion nanum TaxID=256645 RepID=A0A9P9I832_9PLEO|nr:hypothetical protein B0J11DRAFT_585900 [Dendryphion nanum]
MPSCQKPQAHAQSKARRAANNNYLKLRATLYEKLGKLCLEYGAEIYFIARRNGRITGFITPDEGGEPWSPPSQQSLSKMYPPPVLKSPANCRRARHKRAKAIQRETNSQHDAREITASVSSAD